MLCIEPISSQDNSLISKTEPFKHKTNHKTNLMGNICKVQRLKFSYPKKFEVDCGC